MGSLTEKQADKLTNALVCFKDAREILKSLGAEGVDVSDELSIISELSKKCGDEFHKLGYLEF